MKTLSAIVLALLFSNLLFAQNARITKLIDASELFKPGPRSKQKLGADSLVNETDGNGVSSPCRYEKWEQVDSYDEVVQLTPVNDVVWPGSIIQAQSLTYGVPYAVPLRRSGGVITVDGLIFDGKHSINVKTVNKATIDSAISKIIFSNPIKSTVANLSYSMSEINSTEEALMNIGVSAKWGVAGFRAQLNSLDFQTKSNLVVKVVQNYYTVSFTKPDLTEPGAYFAWRESLKNAKRYISPTRPPALISQVNYGRILVFTFSSSRSIQELRTAFTAYYNAVVGPAGNFNLDNSHRQTLESCEIKVFGLGGNSQELLEVLPTATADKLQQVNNYMRNGISFSSRSPGAIIGYKSTFLRDASLASLNSSIKFYKRLCEFTPYKKPITVKVNRLLIFDTADDDEDMGFSYNIEFKDQTNATVATLSNGRGETYVEEPGKIGREKSGVNRFFEGETKTVNSAITKIVVTISARTYDGDGLSWGSVSEYYEAPFNGTYSLSPFGRMKFDFEIR